VFAHDIMRYIVAATWKNRIIPEGLFTLAIFLAKTATIMPCSVFYFFTVAQGGQDE
jgi:hypothetical protein